MRDVRLWDDLCGRYAYEMAPVRSTSMRDAPMGWLYGKHAYKKRIYEMAVYERHAYGGCTLMR
jgi:hypothetical protein